MDDDRKPVAQLGVHARILSHEFARLLEQAAADLLDGVPRVSSRIGREPTLAYRIECGDGREEVQIEYWLSLDSDCNPVCKEFVRSREAERREDVQDDGDEPGVKG